MTLLLAIGGAAAALLALIALLSYLIRPIRRLSDRMEVFHTDWYGQAARPGVPARPGVVERLANIEGEMKANGGSSLRDAVNRLERMVADQGKSN